jgi:proline dehydrogenase
VTCVKEEEEQAMINKQKKKVDTGAVTGHDIEHLLLAMSGLENQGLPVEDTMSTIQKESPENTEEDEEDYLEDYLGDYLGDTEGEEDGGGIFDGEDIAQKMNDLIARSRQGNQEDEEEEEEDDINIVVLEDADKDDGTKTKNHFRTEDISQKKGAGTKKIQKIRRSAFTRPASQKRK